MKSIIDVDFFVVFQVLPLHKIIVGKISMVVEEGTIVMFNLRKVDFKVCFCFLFVCFFCVFFAIQVLMYFFTKITYDSFVIRQ